jgi:hypothetical protein
MFYVGYPITLETARALFKQPDAVDMQQHVKAHGLNLYNIDKGLMVLGYGLKELSNYGPKYVSVDETLILILQYKQRLTTALTISNIDLSDFDIEVMESEPIRVHNPPPYTMTFDDYGQFY